MVHGWITKNKCLRIGIKGIAFAPLNAVFRPQWGDKLLDAQQQVQNHPDDWEAWDRLNDIFTFLHRYEESLDAINHALMIEQEISKLWYIKGELLYLLQQPQEALKALTRATDFAWGKYSRVLRELGRTQEAVDIAKRFVQVQGESPLSWQELGNAYATIGDNEEALEAFEKALSLGKGVEFPGIKELYMVQAEVLSRMGRYEEALTAYSHPFLSLRSQDSTVWQAKARVLQTLGRHDEAVQAEHKA
jgi:tetratricopeptide (TPR) repeat protein